MIVVETSSAIRALLEAERLSGRRIAFVPTMGFLHDGHMELVRRARSIADIVVASIYVNPTQFAPHEDLAAYPRDSKGDREKLESEGCDFLFQPESSEVYPEGFSTFVSVEGVTKRYEGEARPHHFRGVATVVAKLFNIVGPHVAVFGQKDAQQVAVIRRMTTDLDLAIDLEIVQTVREDDGLARSSRNVYLSESERRRAVGLYRGLVAACDAAAAGATVDEARSVLFACVKRDVDAVDYADIVDPVTFEPIDMGGATPALAIVAARVGRTRLIDNMEVRFAPVQNGGDRESVQFAR